MLTYADVCSRMLPDEQGFVVEELSVGRVSKRETRKSSMLVFVKIVYVKMICESRFFPDFKSREL
jgi:hypothetical protein